MKTKYFILIIVLMILVASGAYWYFLMGPNINSRNRVTDTIDRFNPFNRGEVEQEPTTNRPTNTRPVIDTDTNPEPTPINKQPLFRILSKTPVGGYTASSTASSTIIRWIDRGRGNIYQTEIGTEDIMTISNTVVPKIINSVWNNRSDAFISSIIGENDVVSTVYTELRKKRVLASSTEETLYEIKGQNLNKDVITYTASPKRDKILIVYKETNGDSVGYTSTFDGQKTTRVFTTPMNQINIEWPEENTITITTKANSSQNGYMYNINTKTGVWKKVIGPLKGLNTKTSVGGKYTLYSYTDSQGRVRVDILDINKNTTNNLYVSTFADKCVWGRFYTEVVYCGTPIKLDDLKYPEDWYIGKTEFADEIWQINAKTNDIKSVFKPVSQARKLVDAYNMFIDSKDNILLFNNKNDNSLWLVDLVSAK
jgi:hypothetical protein